LRSLLRKHIQLYSDNCIFDSNRVQQKRYPCLNKVSVHEFSLLITISIITHTNDVLFDQDIFHAISQLLET
jgi:hypothetical protein